MTNKLPEPAWKEVLRRSGTDEFIDLPNYVTKDIFLHHQLPFYDPERKWCATDNKENFEINKKTQGDNWHYLTKDVRYNVNSHGYRCDEWENIDWKNSIVILGCSTIFGIGCAEDETVSHYLSQRTGRNVINLGYPGGSVDLIAHHSASLLLNFEIPHAVIVSWPPMDRFMFFSKAIHHCGSWTCAKDVVDDTNLFELFKLRNYNKINEYVNCYQTSKIIEAHWKGRAKYVTGGFFNEATYHLNADLNFEFLDVGRDVVHQGPRSNMMAAYKIHKKLNEQL